MHKLFIDQRFLLSHFEVEVSSVAGDIEKYVKLFIISLLDVEPSLVQNIFWVVAHEDILDRFGSDLGLMVVNFHIVKNVFVLPVDEGQCAVFMVFLAASVHFPHQQDDVLVSEVLPLEDVVHGDHIALLPNIVIPQR